MGSLFGYLTLEGNVEFGDWSWSRQKAVEHIRSFKFCYPEENHGAVLVEFVFEEVN